MEEFRFWSSYHLLFLSDLNYVSINPSSNERWENGTFFADLKGQAWEGKIIQIHYSWTGSFIHPEGNHLKFLIIFNSPYWEASGKENFNMNPIQKKSYSFI